MSNDGIRKPFTRAAGDSARPGDRDLDFLRDKDNAGKEHTPRFAQYPAPNLAPHGMKGIQRQPGTVLRTPREDIQITKGDPARDLHLGGYIQSMDGITFSVKSYDQPSQYGINGGRVSKLDIQEHGRPVVSYDRGWDIMPTTPQAHEALDKVMNHFDPPDLKVDLDRFQPGELTDGYVPERENVTFHAKVEPENHVQGFRGGPVTFLDLRENGLTVARYDHGWVMEPQTQKDRDSVQKISDTLEGFNREFKPLVPPEKDKDHNIDR